MNESLQSALRQARTELESVYEGLAEGVLVVDADSQRIVRANRAVGELLGYAPAELQLLSIAEIHPADSLPNVIEIFEGARRCDSECAAHTPCLRKDGAIVNVELAARRFGDNNPPLVIAFFRRVTEAPRPIERWRADDHRYQFMLEYSIEGFAVIDMEGRIREVNAAYCEMLGFTRTELLTKQIADVEMLKSPAEIAEHIQLVRHTGADRFETQHRRKDGSAVDLDVTVHYCQLENDEFFFGFLRDISDRKQTERALRESEGKLRSLLENLPDLVFTLDRGGIVQFVNRDSADMTREQMRGMCGFDFLIPEHQKTCRNALDHAFATGLSQTVESQDIFGHWWRARLASLLKEGDSDHAMIICTDITQERLATEAVNKEQRLLRRLLELHERERKLMAYEIHDGFAQQLTGALFRLQAFRESHVRNPDEAWKTLDMAIRLIGHAIDETRRLISGLRPPILDESGVVEAIEYLVYEHQRQDGPTIEFTHNVTFGRLAPPLESAIFRIVQESLQNARRHSQSDNVRIELTQHGDRIRIGIRDWGVGFIADAIEERRFGLQGIRERVRLLEGQVVIDSTPGEGTHVSVELPLVDSASHLLDDIEADEEE